MQAILLSAGRGQRLSPITDTVPKPLVKVGGKALIDYQLQKLVSAGIEKVVVNSGWLGQQLIDYLNTEKEYPLKLLYSVEPEIALETAGGIIQALPLIDDDQFIVCNADVFHEFDFSSFQNMILSESGPEAHLLLVDNPEHNPEGDFYLNGESISTVPVGQGKQPFTYSGIGLYSKRFFSGLQHGRRGLGTLLRQKADEARVSGEYFSGAWFDAGTMQRLARIEQYLDSR